MGANPGSCLGRLVIALALTALPACSTAESGASRASCRPADDFSPSLVDAATIFEAISPAYIHRAFPAREDRPLPPDPHEVEINALNTPTIVLVLTNQNRLSKLLAQRDGNDLLVRKFVTYPFEAAKVPGWQGQPEVQQDIRVVENKSLDLDPRGDSSGARPDDIRWEKTGAITTLVVRPASWAQVRSLIIVPVAVHRMKSRQHAADVKAAFPNAPSSAGRFEDLFTVSSAVDSSMNAMWAPAGILFFLSRLEDCEYSSADFIEQRASAQPTASTEDVMPWPLSDCQAQFRRVNSVFNSPEVRGLDVYLWSKVDRVFGYGAPHRSDGPSPGPGAIWLDRTCKTQSTLSGPCARVLAHEAGHFLTLCHICFTPETTPAADLGRCGLCQEIPQCSKAHSGLLMRDDRKVGDDPVFDAWRIPSLAGQEIKEARRAAWERVRAK